MSQIRGSFDWVRGQWNGGGAGKRSAIVVALLFFWPFLFVFGAVALVFEIIASVDRSGRFSTKAHWAIATILVVGGLMAVSALSPSTERTNAADAAAEQTAAAVAMPVATPVASSTPTTAPTATPSAARSTEAPEASAPATPEPVVDVWSRDAAVNLMKGAGFRGSESPLLDGTPRWLGKDGSSNMAEVIGSDRVATVSLTVQANESTGELIGHFLNEWSPSSRSWVVKTLGGYAGTDLDKSKSFSGRTVRVQTLTATDGALVIISIDR